MMTAHDTIMNYYQMNFALQKYHNYSIQELENMWPFEREIYIILIEQWVQEQKDKERSKG